VETVPPDIADDGIPEDVWGQSLMLLDSAEWLVAVPLSPGAARWWGRFTDWCTAETLPSFWEYNDKGPLIVFCARVEGRRWQLHAATGEFRDERNKAVSWRRFLGRYPAVMGAVVNVLRAHVRKGSGA
jgi:hypothetical protein